MSTRVVLCLFLLAAAGGCSGDDSPTAPSGFGTPAPASAFAGRWVGTATDSANGSGTFQTALTQITSPQGVRTPFLSGTWSATFGAGTVAGGASGADFGTTASLTLVPSVAPACSPFTGIGPPGQFLIGDATVTDRTFRATYAFATCGGSVTGTLALNRE